MMYSKRNSIRIASILIASAVMLSFGIVGCAQPSDNPTAVVGGAAGGSCAKALTSAEKNLTYPSNPADGAPTISMAAIFSDNSSCASKSSTLMQLSFPRNVAAANGVIYVSDRSGVKVIDTAKGEMTTLAGITDGRGIAFGSDGTVYIADGGAKGVAVYTNGERTSTIGSGETLNPQGVAVSGSSVYVTDATANVVNVYNGGNKSVLKATSMFAPTGVAIGSNGNVYVLNQGVSKVVVFDASGKQISAFLTKGVNVGQATRPKGIAIDARDQLYVTDAVSNSVQIFSADGAILTGIPMPEDAPIFTIPAGIAVDSQDRIYVADLGANMITVLQYAENK